MFPSKNDTQVAQHLPVYRFLVILLTKSNRDTNKGVPKARIDNYSSVATAGAAIALVTLPERRQRVQA